MYCINCGKEIQENVKFCHNCGAGQQIKENSSEFNKEENSAYYNSRFIKKVKGWYLFWVILNLTFLLVYSKDIFGKKYPSDDFWPFDDTNLRHYDIREFLVYTIFPLLILTAIQLTQLKFGKKNRNI